MQETGVDVAANILDVVVGLLEQDGYDAVQLRTVAKRAHVSLTTIYQMFGNREGLILAAVRSWMANNAYVELQPSEAETLAEGLVRLIRRVFQPWEDSPRMAEAYYRARKAPGGHQLDVQGFAFVVPAAEHLFAGLDRDYVADIGLVLIDLCYAMLGRLVDGSADLPAIMSALERVVKRLTGDNTLLASTRSESESASRSSDFDIDEFSRKAPDAGARGVDSLLLARYRPAAESEPRA
ncbi:TetR family transcriptional regulator [Nocardia bovistercoris]|uniref:TetR family transcriptional regulator n=1 Tax=Nocardia bovistercoris TaxID=2785916 RepID=A0A931IFG1_9NOCA|nr:TetR family transcriptional regulator [Nocardia bovistercoris]MBH0780464.1 TetR family transcriptional regulator [Nocardia bovistercoris]